jgi:CheY-like chemotaxis protein
LATQVIIIDDDNDIREAVHEVLSSEGYGVESFANGKVALEFLAKNEAPRIILLDFMMPVMSGSEVLDSLKKDGRLEKVPVYIMSAARERRGTEAADGYVAKPIELEDLLTLVSQHCQG